MSTHSDKRWARKNLQTIKKAAKGGLRVERTRVEKPFQMRYGHDGERVVIVYSYPVSQMKLTVKEAQEMIAGIQVGIDKLGEHTAETKNG